LRAIYWLLPGQLAGRRGPGWTPWDPAELWAAGLRTVVSLIKSGGDGLEAAGLDHHIAPLAGMALFNFQKDRLVKKMLPLIDLVAREIEAGRPVLVHCRAGKDRTGALLAGYLIRYRDRSPEAAIRLVREVNPRAMTAPGFIRLPQLIAEAT